MNNCSKCGNPLQPGQTVCPICGTNIAIAPITQPVIDNSQKVEPVSVQQEVIEPVSLNKIEEVTPVVPVVPQVVAQQPVQTNQQVIQPVQPVQPVQSVQQVVQPVQQVVQPVQQVAPVVPVTPVVEPIVEQTPVASQGQVVEQVVEPVLQQNLSQNAETVNSASNVVDAMSIPNLEQIEANLEKQQVVQPTKKGFKLTKPMLVAIVVAVLIIFGAGITIKLNSNKAVTTKPNAIQSPEETKIKINTNGFKFEINNTWYVIESGSNTIVSNDSDTLTSKLFILKNSYDTLSASEIEHYFESSEYYKDINVESVTLSSEKKAVKVNLTYNKDNETLLVEYYYIDCGSSMTCGITTIYDNEQIKTDNEDKVKEIAGTLSYSDDSIKALNRTSKYSYMISAGEKIFNDYYYGITDPYDYYTDNEIDNNDSTNDSQDSTDDNYSEIE